MPDQDTVLIPIYARDGSIRNHVLVDVADAEFVNQWHWRLHSRGYACRSYRTNGLKKTILLHRLLLGLNPGDDLEGEHRNRIKLDCRRSNLMILPKAGQPNAQNQGSARGSSSQYRGVYWSKSRRMWAAAVRVNRKTIHLGNFRSETEAAEVARSARKRLMPFATD